MDKIALAESFAAIRAIIDNYIDCYNNDGGQWQLAKLSPNEYYEYCIAGKYPLPAYSSTNEKGHLPRDK